MHLGVSPTHSAAVGRVLNLRTGKITPQCHVAHDELFTTVQGRPQHDALDHATWNELLELGGLEHTLDPADVRGEDVPFSDFCDDFVDLTDEPDDPGQFTDDDVPHGIRSSEKTVRLSCGERGRQHLLQRLICKF